MIITNLGTTFTGSAFWDFCQDNTIDVYYSSIAHPRCNGQVKHTNGMVLRLSKIVSLTTPQTTPPGG
jgi:hypothetical protein